jgi:hypothetical protein
MDVIGHASPDSHLELQLSQDTQKYSIVATLALSIIVYELAH